MATYTKVSVHGCSLPEYFTARCDQAGRASWVGVAMAGTAAPGWYPDNARSRSAAMVGRSAVDRIHTTCPTCCTRGCFRGEEARAWRGGAKWMRGPSRTT